MSNKETKKIDPLRPVDFGLVQHSIRQFNANVSGNMTQNDLENPDLWVNIANKMEIGSEVRCLADDMSFVASGICTYAYGSTVKLKIINFTKLDLVKNVEDDTNSDYEVKNRGPKKWAIVQKSTGDVIKDMIPTQLEAMKELQDYQKALSS